MFFTKRKKLEILDELCRVIDKKMNITRFDIVSSENLQRHEDWKGHIERIEAHTLRIEALYARIANALEKIGGQDGPSSKKAKISKGD